MKKVLMAVVVVGAIALTSCKKEWTCECTTTSGGFSSTALEKSEKMTRSDAKAWCEKDVTVGTSNTTCKLK